MAYRPPNLPPPLPRGEVEAAFARAKLSQEDAPKTPPVEWPDPWVTGHAPIRTSRRTHEYELDGERWLTMTGVAHLVGRDVNWALLFLRRHRVEERAHPAYPHWKLYRAADVLRLYNPRPRPS